jgi:hypothetical protein
LNAHFAAVLAPRTAREVVMLRATFLLLAILCLAPTSVRADSPPNFVIIFADDLVNG